MFFPPSTIFWVGNTPDTEPGGPHPLMPMDPSGFTYKVPVGFRGILKDFWWVCPPAECQASIKPYSALPPPRFTIQLQRYQSNISNEPFNLSLVSSPGLLYRNDNPMAGTTNAHLSTPKIPLALDWRISGGDVLTFGQYFPTEGDNTFGQDPIWFIRFCARIILGPAEIG